MGAAHGGHLEVTRLLLDRSADPNQATTFTALMYAAMHGHLEVAQLLLLFGADPNFRSLPGDTTAQSIALAHGHPAVAACLGAIAGWPAFKIAAGFRLHADARRMLHRGTIEPADCSLAELAAVGGTTARLQTPC